VEHGVHEQREAPREDAPQEGVRRDRAGRHLLEGIDEVVERGLEDGEEAEAHAGRADLGADPVHVPRRRPAEDEHTRGEDDGAQHHGREARLGHGAVVVGLVALDVEALVGDVGDGAEEGADEQRQEGQRADDQVPAALFLELDGEGGQVEVQDAVDEGRIQSDEEADRRRQELEGTDEVFVAQLLQADVPLLVAGVQGPVAGLVA